jgi:hypothetical protein
LVAPASALTGSGSWGHLGTNGETPQGSALNAHVYEMHRAGTILYAGGAFTNAGGIPSADRIASWDGDSWKSLSPTPIADNGSVFAIAHYGGKIYAGGNFMNAGGDPNADNLAVWDGVSWQPFCNSGIGPAFDGNVMALQVIGTTLYVGGTFQNAGGVAAADYLVACDMNTGAMSAVVSTDGDFTGSVYDLTASTDGILYAGGTFSNLDQIAAADFVASFDGTAWSSLGTTAIGGIVRGLHAIGTDVYVSSDGLDIGGESRSDHLVRWDGTTYNPVGSDTAGTNGYFPSSATINELTTSGTLLFAAGQWLDANGQPKADMVAYFDGTTWRAIGSNGAGNGALNANTEGLAVVSGILYAGGASTSAGGDPKANFAASRSLKLADAEIGNSSGNYVGNDVYSTTGAGQTKTVSIGRGTSKFFPVLIQNDGLLPASFTLKGTGAATGYTVTYIDYSNGENITSAIRNGTFNTGTLARGQSFAMKVIVKLSSSAAERGTFLVTAESTAGSPKDTVKGVVDAT